MIFDFVPEFGAQKQVKTNVSNVQFGDGYRQRISKGLNTMPQTWLLTFAFRTAAEASAVEDFLVARAGVEAFEWTPPRGTQLKFICQEWTDVVQKANLYSLTATFEQVFDP